MRILKRAIFCAGMVTALANLMLCCSYNELPGATDAELYEQVVSPSGYIYFNGGLLLAPNPASPHGYFKLRFNDLAASALDTNGRLPVGHIFPNGSMVVKEVYDGGNLVLYAVLRKIRPTRMPGTVGFGLNLVLPARRPSQSSVAVTDASPATAHPLIGI